MTYNDLVTLVSKASGLRVDDVRRVLYHTPDVLLQMKVGERTRTPFGVFKMTERVERQIMLPDGETEATVPRLQFVKLNPGNRLKVDED